MSPVPALTAPPPRRVPEPYLRAEIAAFPLASETAFHQAVLELDPSLAENGATRALWRACESQYAPHTGWSLDRLVAARDRGWFGVEDRRCKVPMLGYLRNLACSHLMRRAGVTEIEESSELSALDATDHYRWLTFTLPEDLLLGALGVEPAPLRVETPTPLLIRRLLDSGVAEIHQHIGAGMDFPLLWVSALAGLATPEVKDEELASPGAPFSDGRWLVRWLLAAAVARCALAEHLIRGGDDLRVFLDAASNPLTRPGWTPRRRDTLVAALSALLRGDEKYLPEVAPLRDLYADLHPSALVLLDRPLQSVEHAFQRCDPIAARLNLCGVNAGQRWLLRKAFAYLANRESPDPLFARLFWQAERVRCQYYRAVVERPLTGGLQWFLRFYGRLGNLRNPLNPILPEVSYQVAGEGHRIRALEFRTSINDSAVQIGEWLLGAMRSWQRVLETSGSLQPEFGVVFHFVKQRDIEDVWLKGGPATFWANTHAEPTKSDKIDVARGRYAAYYDRQAGKARALAELIQAVPVCLWAIRGLDVANDEMGIPTWVLVPLFRHVLDVAAQVSILKEQENAGPPLCVTAHVGEDFRHLQEGMRRIYEQVHYILGGTGGRLGHAIALGVEPRLWAESVGSVLMPAEERLWDLVWEWRLYSKYRIKPEYAAEAPAGRVDVLLNQVRDLSQHVFKHDYPIHELAEVHHVIHRFLVPPYVAEPAVGGGYSTFLNAARDIKKGNRGRDTRHPEHIHGHHRIGRFLETYFEDEAVFCRGQMLIDVSVHSGEIIAMDAVQRALRRGLAYNGIVVEVNPSSNLLIGDLLDLRSHPILRLFPPVPEPDGPPPVAIALGSDDPLTFSTRLLREYTLLHQAACAAGYPERVVHEWLESIRQTGMDARFTKAWKPDAMSMAKTIERKLSRYLQLPCGGTAFG